MKNKAQEEKKNGEKWCGIQRYIGYNQLSNLPEIGVSVKKRVGWKQYSKRMTKNFLKLIKDINPQIPEAQQVPDSVNINRITPRDIRLKLLKTKGKKKKRKSEK